MSPCFTLLFALLASRGDGEGERLSKMLAATFHMSKLGIDSTRSKANFLGLRILVACSSKGAKACDSPMPGIAIVETTGLASASSMPPRKLSFNSLHCVVPHFSSSPSANFRRCVTLLCLTGLQACRCKGFGLPGLGNPPHLCSSSGLKISKAIHSSKYFGRSILCISSFVTFQSPSTLKKTKAYKSIKLHVQVEYQTCAILFF